MEIKKWKPNSTLPILPMPLTTGAICFVDRFRTLYDDDMYDHTVTEYEMYPLERSQIQLGFATAIPEGYYAQIVPLNKSHRWKGLAIVSPEIIDSKYRDEWWVVVVNLSNKKVLLKKGDRICEFILREKINFSFEEVTEFS